MNSFQSTLRVQAGWLTHPPKCSLTDAQMIRKRRMSQDCSCFYFAHARIHYRVEHFGSQKNLGYQVFS